VESRIYVKRRYGDGNAAAIVKNALGDFLQTYL